MEKEIENLITENNELLATKNALNIVKDDLIAKVDELQSELVMCSNEIQQRDAVQERLKSRVNQMEDELKKNKEELEQTKQKLASMNEVILLLSSGSFRTFLAKMPIFLFSLLSCFRTMRKAFQWHRENVSLVLKCHVF